MSDNEKPEDPILAEIGKKIGKVDTLIMRMVRRRMDLSADVVARKVELGKPRIFNSDREEKRLEAVEVWASNHEINRNFARALLYLVIDESCKVQMDLLQMHAGALVY